MVTILAGLFLTSLVLLALSIRQWRRQREEARLLINPPSIEDGHDHDKEGEERLALVSRAGHVGLFEHHHGSGAFYWSPILRNICGVGPDEPVSRQHYLDLIPPDEREHVAGELQAAYDPAGCGTCEIEHRIVKGRDIRYVQLHAETRFQNVDGVRRPVRTLGTVIDITNLKTGSFQQDASQMHAIGTLTGSIAHEFNNRLTAVLGFSELALSLIPADSKAHRHIEQVVMAARKSRELVHQLLSLSQPGNRVKYPLSLHSLLKESLRLLRPTLPAGIELRDRITALTRPISAEAAPMQGMILRLIERALHNMGKTGGVIEIGLHEETLCVNHPTQVPAGPYVCLTVRYTAESAGADMVHPVADPPPTVDSAAMASRLGLSVVQDIVTAHEGTLLVNSGPGNNKTVSVYLPALAPLVPPSSMPDAPVPRRHECILFVDADEALARFSGEMLESLGYFPVIRFSAAAAWKAFQVAPQRFDLLITDRAMPGMTGEMLTRECQRLRPDLPVILCAGPDQAVSSEMATANGIAAYVLKPLSRQDLANTVQRVLDTRMRSAPATGSQFTSSRLIGERDAVSTRR